MSPGRHCPFGRDDFAKGPGLKIHICTSMSVTILACPYGQRFRVEAFCSLETASGVLQYVSPWSTSTLPMRLAVSIAFLRRAGLKVPIAMIAPFIAYRAQFGE